MALPFHPPPHHDAHALEVELLRSGLRHVRACVAVLLLGFLSLACIGAAQGGWIGALLFVVSAGGLAWWRLKLAARLTSESAELARERASLDGLQRATAFHFAACGLVYAAGLAAWYPDSSADARALMAFVAGTALAGAAHCIAMTRQGLAAFLTPPLAVLAVQWISTAETAHDLSVRVVACIAAMAASITIGAWLHRKALREAIESRNVAHESGQAKSRFLATMSHEIRTPMQGILGSLEQLGRSPLPTEQQRWLVNALSSGRALLEVLNQVLERSRLDAGPLRLASVPFDLRLTVQSSVDLFRAQAAAKRLDLDFFGEPGTEGMWMGDGPRLQQLVMNLVGNALKFTRKGCVSVKLRRLVHDEYLALADEREWLVIDVIDSGRGISADSLAHIFEPFYQAEMGPFDGTCGSGLGLSICQALVSQMGGAIVVDSAPGVGSTFRVRLPLRRAHMTPVHSAPEEPAQARAATSLQGWTVVIAEDDPVLAMVSAAILEDQGVTVLAAPDGAQALELAQTQAVDLVLMDLQMPNLDGLQATRRLRTWEAATGRAPLPVIAMSANAEAEDLRACRAAGMNDHVAKPFSHRELIAALSRWPPHRAAKLRPKSFAVSHTPAPLSNETPGQ